jgi:hypothetical protein
MELADPSLAGFLSKFPANPGALSRGEGRPSGGDPNSGPALQNLLAGSEKHGRPFLAEFFPNQVDFVPKDNHKRAPFKSVLFQIFLKNRR